MDVDAGFAFGRLGHRLTRTIEEATAGHRSGQWLRSAVAAKSPLPPIFAWPRQTPCRATGS